MQMRTGGLARAWLVAAWAAALTAGSQERDPLVPAELPAGPRRRGDLVRVDIALPRPLFVGTPKDIRTPNLEPDRKGKLRPAYYAPEGVTLLSRGRPVTSSDVNPVIGEPACVTDGNKEAGEGAFVELGPGRQYVQLDLGAVREVHAIVIWHFHSQARVYRDVVVQMTVDDPDFVLAPATVFNNDHDNSSGLGIGSDFEYIETFEGRLVPAGGRKARYLRFYSNGNTANEMNHYVEIEVYGR